MPVANARMYSVNAECKADWQRVLRWALDRADLDWPIIDHDAPAPLARLWARDDLGAVLMCGLPFALREPPPTAIAAPLPSPPRYAGRAIYCTDIAVAADAPHRTLEDTFGGVVGYTVADSLSGAVAWLEHLRPARAARGARLYRAAVGGLLNARGVIGALADGRIDVGPLDSYSHDLLKHYEPALAARVRTVASTAWRPIPPFVASAAVEPDALARLREALLATARASALADAMSRLQLAGFAVPAPADYGGLAALARNADLSFEDL